MGGGKGKNGDGEENGENGCHGFRMICGQVSRL